MTAKPIDKHTTGETATSKGLFGSVLHGVVANRQPECIDALVESVNFTIFTAIDDLFILF